MTMTVDNRFRGPADSGNGGYVCGVLAAHAGSTPGGVGAVVTLRKPPPLDTPLAMVSEGDGLRLVHGDTLVAEAARSRLDVAPIPPVDAGTARDASHHYPGFGQAPVPGVLRLRPRPRTG